MLDEPTLKQVTIIGPLLASALAVTYDVGFFYGSDIGFFTFFSLAEHLVFALQAAPFALLVAGGIIGWPLGVLLGAQRGREIATAAIAAGPEELQRVVKKADKDIEWQRKARSIAASMALGIAVFLLTERQFTGAIANLFAAASIAIFPNVVEIRDRPSVRTSVTIIIAMTTFLMAFSFGYDRAQAIVTSQSPTELISVGLMALPARLIRSGDKGVLFYSIETKKIRFLRWDSVKGIESI
ncbi:hypothetical protein [Bradyrhizobium sp. RT10b]|uniref:hypothetical protein n=1 Tax=Bradyrhizobium sp. RT10b TaxID=3156331 RepID=UPI003391AE12